MHLHLDCFSGVSGDMFLGALVDAGVSPEQLEGPLRSLGVEGWELLVSGRRDPRLGGTDVEVLLGEGHDGHGRHLSTILGLIEKARDLPGDVASRSAAVFDALADAESEVHGVSKEELHFHEVGAVDAIIDIVGSVLGLHLLGVTSLSCSPLPLGSGFVECAHGTIPVPVPATLLLLRGLPTVPARGSAPTGELVTPTGAALIRTLADSFGSPPPMEIQRVAHGLGSRDRGPVPNALRVLLGHRTDGESQEVCVLTTTIDDMDSRLFGPLMDGLFADGAIDAILTPTHGKKGRPAVQLTVLCGAELTLRSRLERRIFRETTSLGLRWHTERRTTLRRRSVTVETRFGPLPVKEGLLGDDVVTIQPEFEPCLTAARAANVPVAEVIEAARAARLVE